MPKKIAFGFDLEEIVLPLGRIVSHKEITDVIRATRKYKQIAAAMKYVGMVEPIVVFPMSEKKGYFRLLGGHIRLDILRCAGETETICLLSKDDEGFTYNHRISRLSPIQEHFMILEAIKKGVAESLIAKSLNVNIGHIRSKRDLLQGICAEAVNCMKDHPFSPAAIRVIRKMHPTRQITVAKHMIAMNSFSEKFALQMLASTPQNMLLDSKPKYMESLAAETIAQMDMELSQSRGQQEDIREQLGIINVQLTRTSTYCEKLLRNKLVSQYIKKNHPQEFGDMNQLLEMYRTAKKKVAA